MDKLITDIHNIILEKWNASKSIPLSDIPDHDEVDLSKLIVHYSPAWFIALINPGEDILVVNYARVHKSADLPHLLLNYDHISTKDYFTRYLSKYMLIQQSVIPGVYRTEFFDHNGNLLNVRDCSINEFVSHIENEMNQA